MTIAMFYGGYGFGGGWILLLLLGFLVIRTIASQRSGPRGRPPDNQRPPPGFWSGIPQPPRAPDGPTKGPQAPDHTRVAGHPAPPGGTYKIPPGWFPDPTGRFDQRYWSGTAWTEHVTKDGVPGTDAPPASLSGAG